MSNSSSDRLAEEIPAAHAPPTLSGESALQRLLEGNHRYLTEKPLHPRRTAARRAEIAQRQHPFAIILGCADSRVPPEIIFDQGFGDLFVIRTAGHVIDTAALASVEYAVEELGVPLLMVLGHERCGAVKAAVAVVNNGGTVPGHIMFLVDAIKPAVEQAKGSPGDLLDNAVKAHTALVVKQLQTAAPILAPVVRESRLRIVGAHHDLDSGVVELIP